MRYGYNDRLLNQWKETVCSEKDEDIRRVRKMRLHKAPAMFGKFERG